MNGRLAGTETVSLPEGNTVDIKDRCKYLGTWQPNKNIEEAPRELATAKYLQREKTILSSQLNGKNKLWAISPDALSVRYTGIIGTVVHYTGVINLAKYNIKGVDINTKKLPTIHGTFHTNSSPRGP